MSEEKYIVRVLNTFMVSANERALLEVRREL